MSNGSVSCFDIPLTFACLREAPPPEALRRAGASAKAGVLTFELKIQQLKILLHICCANCAIYPLERLKEKGNEAVGYFFNPNIHPYQEYEKRLDALKKYSGSAGLKVVYRDEYLLEEFLRNVSHRVEERCQYCYSLRLEATAREAKDRAFDGFSTTLLQSTHQNHAKIKEVGERVAQEVGIPFYYEDFRPGWKRGVEVSKALGLYRQQYCGCIYSEKERFLKSNKMSNDKVQRREGKME